MISNEELTQAIAELRASQAQTDKQIQETSQQMKQTDKLVKALSQNIDGVNKSIGLEVEDFFYSSLSKNPSIGNINFDYVYQNDIRNIQGKTQEIDILLENGSSVGVVEVKNKVTQKSIDQLDKIMDNFYYFHRDYKDYKVIGAIAGKIFPKHLQAQALKKGYSVLTQQGDHVEQINP
ncbi:MAG: hypothetical protein Q9M36_14970 [Sulfurovum sp.]|nr:hypothetical protein [Sulfurovum sp.]